jgi:hypothetical protein
VILSRISSRWPGTITWPSSRGPLWPTGGYRLVTRYSVAALLWKPTDGLAEGGARGLGHIPQGNERRAHQDESLIAQSCGPSPAGGRGSAVRASGCMSRVSLPVSRRQRPWWCCRSSCHRGRRQWGGKGGVGGGSCDQQTSRGTC